MKADPPVLSHDTFRAGSVPESRDFPLQASCRWFLSGLSMAFVLCCLAGYVASHLNSYRHFQRFHVAISPETLFYPTISELREIAWQPDDSKITVIVGGSSNFHGVSQTVDRLWTRRLQALLGDRYVVRNFAFRGALPTEGGAIAAETLYKSGRKVIYVADFSPGLAPSPDGQVYRYLFWDAYYKGLLLSDPIREMGLRESIAGRSKEATSVDFRLGERLDSLLYFNDLWTTIAYRWIFTVWTPGASDWFLRARQYYPDPEKEGAGTAVDLRYASHDNQQEMRIVRARISVLFDRDDKGREHEDFENGTWKAFQTAIRQVMPPPMRGRSLMVVLPESPFYLKQLTAEEQNAYEQTARQTVAELNAAGYGATTPIGIFNAGDYNDRTHMVASGGDKLADFIAPMIREIARLMNYGMTEEKK